LTTTKPAKQARQLLIAGGALALVGAVGLTLAASGAAGGSSGTSPKRDPLKAA
jgi:hypothetical protein